MRTNRTTMWLIGASSGLLLLFLSLAVSAYLNCRRAEADSVLISTDAIPGSVAAHHLRVSASTCARLLVLATVTEDATVRADSLAQASEAEADFARAVEQYKVTTRINPDQDRELINQLESYYADFRRKRAQFGELLRSGDRPASRAFFEHEVIPAFVPVTESADTLLAYNQANVVKLAEAIAQRSRSLRTTMLATLGLSLVCGVILAVNLSAWRREQRTARENEHRLRGILDHMSSLIGLCDVEGRLIEVNQTALTAAGVARGDLLGRPLYETPWRHTDPDRNAQRQLKECVEKARQGTPSRFDVVFRTTTGGRITLDFRCDPIRDAAGRIQHLLVSGIDVTERDKLKQQFLKAQRMEAIGTLSSGLAHDLNNILAPMLMAAGLLKLKLDEPRDRNIVNMIETSVQRGAGIIRQLLAFGRGQEGPLGSIQLRHLIKDIAQIVQETFPRNIEFDYHAPTDLNPIVGDPTQFHQVMLNLCVNARDAMPNGGKLTLSAENVQLSATDVSAHAPAKPGSYVKLAVRDTGEGMTPEIQDRIFDPFFSTKAPGKGTGLGLPSVLAIVKGHHGFLTVDSEVGRGSTFTIFIPAATQPATSLSTPPIDHLPLGSGETILVVDDEPAIRTALREMLEAHEYRAVTAQDGDEAVRLFVQNRETIKLVICDIQMPVMSGAELIRSLRLLNPRLKFVIMTGSSHGERRAELAGLGVTDILDKPCPALKLLTVLHNRLADQGRP